MLGFLRSGQIVVGGGIVVAFRGGDPGGDDRRQGEFVGNRSAGGKAGQAGHQPRQSFRGQRQEIFVRMAFRQRHADGLDVLPGQSVPGERYLVRTGHVASSSSLLLPISEDNKMETENFRFGKFCLTPGGGSASVAMSFEEECPCPIVRCRRARDWPRRCPTCRSSTWSIAAAKRRSARPCARPSTPREGRRFYAIS